MDAVKLNELGFLTSFETTFLLLAEAHSWNIGLHDLVYPLSSFLSKVTWALPKELESEVLYLCREQAYYRQCQRELSHAVLPMCSYPFLEGV